MIIDPDARELVEAVADWLDGLSGQANEYERRVAVNALKTVAREFDQGPAALAAARDRMRAILGEDGDAATLNTHLAHRIRDGKIAPDDPALFDHLKRATLDLLAIDQPRYRHSLTPPEKTR